MLRYLLVLLLGLLLGANVAWYVAQSRRPPCAAPSPAAVPVQAPAAGTAMPGASSQPTPVLSPTATPTPVAGPGDATAATPVVPAARTASGLVIPVAGVQASQLVDTYTQSRSEGRLHEAIDIMAPAGTPVVAAVDGPVAKLFTSERGGLTVYQFDTDGRRVYYYAHLQGYAPGLAAGDMLRQGEVLGYVGSTGDASPTAPHLHFSVGDLGPEKQWWKSSPINPYPLLSR